MKPLVLLLALLAGAAAASEEGMQARLERAMHTFYFGSADDAFRQFGELAELGCAKAQTRYALMVDTNPALGSTGKALSWLTQAAERGDTHAQYSLGSAYDVGGWGLGPRDFEYARRWYLLAAAQGHPLAMEELFQMYLMGRDVEPDSIEAYKWLTLAIPRLPPPTAESAYGVGVGHQARQRALSMREKLARHMKPAQIAEAERRAREWEQAHNHIRHMPERSDRPIPLWYLAIEGGCDD